MINDGELVTLYKIGKINILVFEIYINGDTVNTRNYSKPLKYNKKYKSIKHNNIIEAKNTYEQLIHKHITNKYCSSIINSILGSYIITEYNILNKTLTFKNNNYSVYPYIQGDRCLTYYDDNYNDWILITNKNKIQYSTIKNNLYYFSKDYCYDGEIIEYNDIKKFNKLNKYINCFKNISIIKNSKLKNKLYYLIYDITNTYLNTIDRYEILKKENYNKVVKLVNKYIINDNEEFNNICNDKYKNILIKNNMTYDKCSNYILKHI